VIFFIFMVVICTKNLEMVDGYFVLGGIMDWVVFFG
jgi:hypothetical protein